MTVERFRKLEAVFEAARALDPDARTRYLDEQCGGDESLRREVDALLDRDVDESSLLDRPEAALRPHLDALEDAPATGRPEQIGSYRIMGVLGTGGMGVVYRAEQTSPRRTVALKVIRTPAADSRSLRRFEREAEVLGRLQHPGIAQIFESGVAETPHGPQPFFAMELIDGRPITAYAAEFELEPRERLRLLAQVCDAVHHAHLKGVIHRDIKPSNILVTADADGAGGTRTRSDDGLRVKVLDFGIARAVDHDGRMSTLRTDVGQLVGTIPYMSPEQVSGDPSEIDARCDVYALGVLGFELLTGRLPHEVIDCAVPEAVRRIRDNEPAPLGSIDRTYRGDLDTIIAKALARERERRYQSAAELAADVRRFLGDEPIVARPPSTFYQLSKFTRRNRVLVGGAAATFLALAIGLVVSFTLFLQAASERNLKEIQRGRAETARQTAQRRLGEALAARDESEAVTSFLVEMLETVRTRADGRDVLVRDMLDEVADSIMVDAGDRPLLESRIRASVGRAYYALGEYARGGAHLERSAELRRELLGPDDPLTCDALHTLALCRLGEDRIDEAEVLLLEVVRVSERTIGEVDPLTLASIQALGGIYERQQRYDEAIAMMVPAVEHLRRIAGPDSPDALLFGVELGQVYARMDLFDDAEPLLQDARERLTRTLGPDHPKTLRAVRGLADLRRRQGRLDEAEAYYRQVVDRDPPWLGERHPDRLTAIVGLGSLYRATGRYDESERLLTEARTGLAAELGSDHPSTLTAADALARLYRTRGQFEPAERLFREVLDRRRAVLGDEHADTLTSMNNLASLYWSTGRQDEAEPLFERTIELQRRLLGPEHGETLVSMHNLASVYRHQGRLSEAAALYREVLDARRRQTPPDTRSTVLVTMDLAGALEEAGDRDAATALVEKGLERCERGLGPDDRMTFRSMNRLATFYRRSDRLDDAEALCRRALVGQRRVYGDTHPDVLMTLNNLASVLMTMERLEDAEHVYAEAAAGAESLHPDDWRRSGALLVGHGRVLTSLGRHDEADATLQAALEILQTSRGADHPRTRDCRAALAELDEARGTEGE